MPKRKFKVKKEGFSSELAEEYSEHQTVKDNIGDSKLQTRRGQKQLPTDRNCQLLRFHSTTVGWQMAAESYEKQKMFAKDYKD